MTDEEALAWWFGRINYEVRSATPRDLKLERMRAILRRLDQPQERLRVIHVAGTKGKGSTCAMLAAVLQAAGYRVGLFTSPHLEHVSERVQVDGVPISAAELTARLNEIRPVVEAVEGTGPAVTFFEISTAVGFLHFLYRRCDFAVIEVGLGGRYDSTNVCWPLVAVITNIGYDHMAQLGSTLEAIAYQKAGIIKRGRPVVSGERQSGPRGVIRAVAAEQQARLIEVTDATRQLAQRYAIGLAGEHQRENAAVVITVVDSLRQLGVPVSESSVVHGLAHVRWPARVECVRRRPTVILDTAHNVPSIEALLSTLQQDFAVNGRRRLIFAVSSDKDYPAMLQRLANFFDEFHLTRYGNNPRCVAPERLGEVLRTLQPSAAIQLHDHSQIAWAAASADLGPDDLLCVTGSVFLAGELQRPIREWAVYMHNLNPLAPLADCRL
jgi:dihydrofolate synthase/folylpolyglutamate synthase